MFPVIVDVCMQVRLSPSRVFPCFLAEEACQFSLVAGAWTLKKMTMGRTILIQLYSSAHAHTWPGRKPRRLTLPTNRAWDSVGKVHHRM